MDASARVDDDFAPDPISESPHSGATSVCWGSVRFVYRHPGR